MKISTSPARPTKITVTTRAKDGVPANQWRAEIWYVAGRVEIDMFKNDECWAQSIPPCEVRSVVRLGSPSKRVRYITGKITALAKTVRAVNVSADRRYPRERLQK